MSIFKKSILTLVAVVCSVSNAGAQSCESGYHQNSDRHHPHFAHVGRGYYNGHYGYRYGTYGTYANYAHGHADLIRSRAYANLLNAQAWTQAEAARTHNLQNNVLALETRLERRRINTESRFGKLHALAAQRKAMQAELVQVKFDNGINPAKPDGLRFDELDPLTGDIRWPLLLRSSHFERARPPVEEVFATRAKFGTIHPDDYLPLRNWISRIQAELNKHIESLPKEDYAEAQYFLRRVVVELREDQQSVLPAGILASK